MKRIVSISAIILLLPMLYLAWISHSHIDVTAMLIGQNKPVSYAAGDGGALQEFRDVLASCKSEFHWEGTEDELSLASEGIKLELDDKTANWHLRSYDNWASACGGGKARIDITGLRYWCSAEQKITAEQEISAIVEKASTKTSTRAKALTIHNWLAKNVEYSKNLTTKSKQAKMQTRAYRMAHNAAGSLVSGWYHGKDGGYGVCSSYAEAFDVIAKRCGLETRMVKSKTHRWNQIRSDNGEWYNIDVTFDDGKNKISQKWFWITDDRLERLDAIRNSSAHVMI